MTLWGWGDYLWNGVVQFFCSPMQGAFTMALLCAVLQLISMWLFHRLLRNRWRVVSVLLSLILPMLLCIKVYKPVGGRIADAIDAICHAYHSSHVSSLVDVLLLGYWEQQNIPYRV